MFAFPWFRGPSHKSDRVPRRRWRPRLEALEDRLTPANITATGGHLLAFNDAVIPNNTVDKGEAFYVDVDWDSTNLPGNASYGISYTVDSPAPGDNVTLTTSGITLGAGYSTFHADWNLGWWFGSPGAHNVSVTVNPAPHTVTETNYADNTATFTAPDPVTATDLPQKFINPLRGTPFQTWDIYDYDHVWYAADDSALDFMHGPYTSRNWTSHALEVPDFGAMDAGVAVVAAADGTVANVQDGNYDRNTSLNSNAKSNYVDIDHGNGWHTLYYAMRTDSILVHKGDHVVAGQVLGLAGSSGYSTGAHLDFEIDHNSDPVEPEYDPNTYWANPLPYQGTVSDVLEAGVTASQTILENQLNAGEHPVSANTFTQASGQTLTAWLLGSLRANDQVTYRFYTPSNSDYTALDYSYTSALLHGSYADHAFSLPANLALGTWHVAVEVNGTEMARVPFTVSTGGAGATRVNQASGPYVANNRTTPIDFGSVPPATSPPQLTFNVSNLGTAALHLSNLVLPAGFSLVGSLPSTVLAGSPQAITVQMNTGTSGTYAGVLQFSTDDPNAPTYSFAIKGTVTGGNSGAIHGQVFNDLNSDGIENGTDVGRPGVTVSLINPNTNAVLATTTTGNNGYFAFYNLGAASYRVRETLPAGLVQSSANPADVVVTTADELASPVGLATPVATSLAYGVQPGTAVAGQALNPAVTVKVLDQFGNLMASDNTDQLTMAVASGPGSFTAGSSATVTVSGGTGTFSNLVLTRAGTYTLKASATGLTGITSNSFTENAAAADHLAIGQQPTATTAGAAITPAVTVQILDAFNNPTTSTATVALAPNGPGAFGSGSTTSVGAISGVATFGNLHLNTAGSYTLTASATGLAGITSSSFGVSAAADNHLAFVQQPANTTAGTAIPSAVTVQILDAFNNPTGSTATVALTPNGPGPFATGSTSSVAAVGGVATFSNLVLNKAGTYTLKATGAGLTADTSTSFVVSAAAADHLAFAQQPTNTPTGAAITPAVTVQILDQFNNLTTSTASVTLAANGPGPFTAGSTTVVPASGGVASFGNLHLNSPGSYTLGASATNLTGATSNTFSVSALPNHLAFGQQPTAATAGGAIAPAVTVQILDQFNNLTASTATVALAATGPGPFSAGSTTSVGASEGVATFNNLVLTKAGSYTLTASSTGLTGATSTSFVVSPAAAERLAFGQQPTSTPAGGTIASAVTVQLFDHYGNLATGDNTDQVILTVASGPGSFATGSTTTATVSGGIATFNNLVLTRAGTYTLAASAGNLTGVTSGTFTINPAAADHLAFGQLPTGATASVAIAPAVAVQIFDHYGNLLTGDNTDQLTVSVASGPGTFTAGSTTSMTVSSGAAAFGNLVLIKAGTYTLNATGAGLPAIATGTFAVNPGAADHLAFVVPPSTGTADIFLNPAVQVEVLDFYNNLLAADNSHQVTVAVASGPGGFSSGSTTTATVANGIATFNRLALTAAGTYTLRPSASGGLTGADSGPFSIGPAVPDHLAFGVPPANALAGQVLTPAVTVLVLDAAGNVVAGDTSQVTLTLGINPGGATLGGTHTVAAVNGVATFSNLSLDKAGVGYTLTATDGGLPALGSAAFTITSPVPGALQFSAAGYTGAENGGTATIQVTRTGGADGTVTVQYATADSTAQAGRDYTAAAGTLTFGPGVTSQTFTVPLRDNGLVTLDGLTVNLTLSQPGGGATMGTAAAVLTIADSDLPIVPNAPPSAALTAVATAFAHSREHYQQFVVNAYQQYLKRRPDDSGLNFWVNNMLSGVYTDEQVEAFFIGSDEYIANHGGPGAAWVTGMYKDLLGRTPSAAEVQGWVSVLNAGTPASAVALGFAASRERESQRVRFNYQTYLGRDARQDEVDEWVNAFVGGLTNEGMVGGFVGSPEYYLSTLKGNDNPARWVARAYLDVLFRPAAVGEVNNWLQVLR
jgi:hypothetical protein